MIPAERQRAILALLGNQQVISINELTQQLDVSHMTIRRISPSWKLTGE